MGFQKWMECLTWLSSAFLTPKNKTVVYLTGRIENDLSRSGSNSQRTYEVISNYILGSENEAVNGAKSVNAVGERVSDGPESEGTLEHNNGDERGFRELQEASRSLPDERVMLFRSGERLVDEGMRGRLSGVLSRELSDKRRSSGYGSASLVNES